MDLNTIATVAHPTTRDQLPVWTAGDAWLAGGTWLFSEPQVHLTRLIDLTDLKWPALTISETGLSIAATCTVAQLDALACPPDWIAAPLINQCCRAFLASFKIWKTLPCDVFLGAHGNYYGLEEKYPRLAKGEQGVFVDPAGYRAYIEEREQAFKKRLAEQQAPAKGASTK